MNNQKPENVAGNLPEDVDVVDVFTTIQGEGPYAGQKATFIRTAGCNIICPWCDTNYTKGRKKTPIDVLVDKVSAPLVVITGGEPLRQNLSLLIESLATVKAVKTIQIETNGTLCPEWLQFLLKQRSCPVEIVISPKTTNVHPEFSQFDVYWKYIVAADDKIGSNGLPTHTMGRDTPVAKPFGNLDRLVDEGRIFLQPLDEQDPQANSENIAMCANLCLLHGFRLCIQIQKIARLP